jgi:methylated-DNA-[protein]-cysteine S-methyltransferase
MSAPRWYTRIPSPLGPLLLAGTPDALTDIRLPGERAPLAPGSGWTASDAPFRDAIRQLEAYFAGALRRFDLRLEPAGTPFQQRVWGALLEIPYGETISYAELARRIGRPDAFRAVGAANGRNPLPIVIPCHRVIGHDGRLVGYGGGLPAKERLLALERRVAGPGPAGAPRGAEAGGGGRRRGARAAGHVQGVLFAGAGVEA